MSERLRKRVVKASLALAMVLATTAVFAGIAQAAVEHPYLGAMDGSDTSGERFEYPCGVAVDPAGYLYVASAGTFSINVFNPQHEFLTSIFDGKEACNLSVDSEGNIYALQTQIGAVELYSPDSYPPTATTTYDGSIFFEEANVVANGVAVNPANDHVFVTRKGSSSDGIGEYKSAAEGSGLISGDIGKGLVGFGGELQASRYQSIQIYGANGDIYLTIVHSNSEGHITHEEAVILNPAGTEVLAHFPEFSLPHFGSPAIAVNQANGNVLVSWIDQEKFEGVDLLQPRAIGEYKPDGTLVSQIGPTFGSGLEFQSSLPSGLAVDNSATANAGNVYVGSGELEAHVYEFGPLLINPKPLTVTKAGTGSGTVSSSPLRIECGSKCSAEFSEGETVTLTAAPAAGSKLSGWSGCTSEAEGGKKCLVTIGATNAVTATFEPKPKFALSVSKDGTGSGSITSSPAGIDCGSTCSAEFEEGAEVTLSPSATSGSSFAGWSGACTGTGTCKVTVDAAKAVTATFNINASGGGGTTTTPPPTPTCATDAALCPPGTASVASKAQVKSGKAALSVTCPGPGACSGKVTLTAKITTGKGKNKKTKKQTIGSASFSLTPGGSSTVQVKLSGPAKSAIAKGTLKASVSGTGVAAGSVKLSQGGGK